MLPENLQGLERLAQELRLSDEQVDRFSLYIELIETWNQRTNLVSAGDIGRLVSRHIRDSLVFRQAPVWRAGARVIGSGGGFPGVPLKVMDSSIDLVMVESKRFKALFLQQVVETLSLQRTAVLDTRAEAVPRGKYEVDIVVARAVAPLVKLWKWSAPFRHARAVLLTVKGKEWQNEAKILQKRVPVDVQEISVIVDSVSRSLLIVKPANRLPVVYSKGESGEQGDF